MVSSNQQSTSHNNRRTLGQDFLNVFLSVSYYINKPFRQEDIGTME